MSLISGPGRCKICATDLPSPASAMGHYTSVHMAISPFNTWYYNDYESASISSSLTPPAPGSLASLGIDFISASALRPSDLNQGKYVATADVLAWTRTQLGETTSAIVALDTFLVQFLHLLCAHGGTSKLNGLGSFKIYFIQGSAPSQMTWSNFFNSFFTWCRDTHNVEGTVRTYMTSVDEILLPLWDAEIPVMATLRSTGTARSAKFTNGSGGAVPAWWTVPGLFKSRRSEIPSDFVAVLNAAARPDIPTGDYQYGGFDADLRVQQHLAMQRTLTQQGKGTPKAIGWQTTSQP